MSDIETALVEKIIYTAFFVPLLLSGVIIWFLIFYQKKKYATQLREKDLIISRQEALEAERTRIAGEMHDELGGGLTSIKFLSQSVLRKIENTREKERMQKIVNHTEELVGNMSEIIWAMNSGFDSLESLVAYVRHYAHQYLSDFEIDLDFQINGVAKDMVISGEKRRNIFLVIKEALHNAVKHADASKIIILFEVGKKIEIRIADNGKGTIILPTDVGNGIENMKKRVSQLQGIFEMKSENGTEICLQLPIPDQDFRIPLMEV